MNSSLDPNMIEKMFAYADSDGSGLITQEIDQKRGAKRVWEGGKAWRRGWKGDWLMFVFGLGWVKLWFNPILELLRRCCRDCFYTSIIVNIHVAYLHCRYNAQCLNDGAGNHERFGFLPGVRVHVVSTTRPISLMSLYVGLTIKFTMTPKGRGKPRVCA